MSNSLTHSSSYTWMSLWIYIRASPFRRSSDIVDLDIVFSLFMELKLLSDSHDVTGYTQRSFKIVKMLGNTVWSHFLRAPWAVFGHSCSSTDFQ